MISEIPVIYIMLPVHNRIKFTSKFIDCLINQTYSNYHLLLIDDGSTDGTADMVRSSVQNLTVISGEGKWWWAGGLQKGVDWLKNSCMVEDHDIVLTINDDVVFDERFLQNAVDKLDNYHDVILHPTIYGIKTGKLVSRGVHANFKDLTFELTTETEKINCLSTMGLFMRFADLKEIGDFYPVLLPHYLSDYEYTIRAYRKGFKLICDSKLQLFVNEASTGVIEYKNFGFKDFIKIYFSNKAKMNPIHWTNFILLTSPPLLIPINLFRVWKRSIVKVLRKIASSMLIDRVKY